MLFSLILTLGSAFIAYAEPHSPDLGLPSFLPCTPESEPLKGGLPGDPPRSFCEKWNPDFSFNGYQCCGKLPIRVGRRKKRLNHCPPQRVKKGNCSEMTAEQLEYTESVHSWKIPDLLAYLTEQMGRSGEQSFCSVNNGFLAHGRRVIGTDKNRIFVRAPGRCVHFGTDAMVGMLEWLGRQLATAYPGESNSGVQLSVGDISAPRGGCLFGVSGRRGHASHTSGQDADIGFINPKAGKTPPASPFTRTLEPKTNWWFLTRVFKNPFACIKVIFLDRHHIRTLEKHAKKDPEWKTYHRFIRHMPGHKNHFHIRIGNGPGEPGCVPGARPELEPEEDQDTTDIDDSTILDQILGEPSS